MKRNTKDPQRALQDERALDRAIVSAHRRVILKHRQLGTPLVLWQNEMVTEVPADRVELPEYEDDDPAA
jgi:hypothetical protein